MSQYRKIRAQDPDGEQEVEYNLGRFFHQIGQLSLHCRWGSRLTNRRTVLARRTALRTGVGDRREKSWRGPQGAYSLEVFGRRIDALGREAGLKRKPRTISL